MGLPYRDVKDLYDTLRDAGAVTQSLPDWSTEMNRLTESDLYNAGQHDNWVKHASVGLDRLLEATHLPELSASFGRVVGGAVGAPDTGESIGHGLPRMGVNFLPLLAGPFGVGATAAGLAGTAALSGAETYTNTGSPAAGVISGLTNAAMPGVAGAGEQLALRGLGAKVLQGPIEGFLNGSRLPETVLQKAASLLGGQASAAAFGEGSGALQNYMAGQDQHFSPVDSLLGLTLGQLPFAALHLATHGLDPWTNEGLQRKVADTQDALQVAQAKQDFKEAQRRTVEENPTQLPEFTPTEDQEPNILQRAKYSFELGKLRGEMVANEKQATTISAAEYYAQEKAEQELVQKQWELSKGKGTVGGEVLDPSSPRHLISGTVIGERKADATGRGGYRKIKVDDNPANEASGAKPGDVLVYSTLHEPTPIDDPAGSGNKVFSLPTRFTSKGSDWATEKLAKAEAERVARAVQNPDLPTQDTPLDLGQFHEQLAGLAEVRNRLEATTTPMELRQVMVDYNNARLSAGLEPWDDAKWTDYAKRFADGDIKKAVRSKLTDNARAFATVETAKQKELVRQSQVQTAQEDYVAPLLEAQRVKQGVDPDTLTKADNYTKLRDKLVTSANGSTLVSSGEYDRLFHQMTGSAETPEEFAAKFQQFAASISQRALTGKGITPSMRGITPKVKEVLQDTEPDTAPIRAALTEIGKASVDAPGVKVAYDTWPAKAERTLEQDQNTFRQLVDEFGSISDLSPEDLAESWKEYGMGHTGGSVDQEGGGRERGTAVASVSGNDAELLDEARSFLEAPHVQEMSRVYDEGVKKLRDENTLPKPTPQPKSLVTPELRYKIAEAVYKRAVSAHPDSEGVLANWLDWVEGRTKEIPEGLKSDPAIDDANDALRQYLQEMEQKLGGTSRTIDELPKDKGFIGAGANFMFSLAPFDAATNVLNGKHKLPASGLVREGAFRNMAGRDGRPITEAEMQLHKLLVPEAFKEGNVDVKELYRLLPERQPVTEVVKLGGEQSKRIDQIRHEFDSMSNVQYDGERARIEGQARPETRALVEEYNRLILTEGTQGQHASRFSFLGPKSESNMPGYVEGLVRKPESFRERQLVRTDYSGPHFGTEHDKNVLAFFRGYEETLPDGRKAFHVIEVQSDWGQARKKQEDLIKGYRPSPATEDVGRRMHEQRAAKLDNEVKGHPLLSVYEPLALKAAIDHARSVGADVLVLSDAETAMMTEGHDKTMPRSEMTDEERKNWQPSQAPGMRFHYPTTSGPDTSSLGRAMVKLTGGEGVPVELGTHKEAIQRGLQGAVEQQPWQMENTLTGEIRFAGTEEGINRRVAGEPNPQNWVVGPNIELQNENKVIGSPVFRDESGAPKSSITGRVYDLHPAFAKQDAQGGKFTLTEPSRTLDQYVPQDGYEAKKIRDYGIGKTGAELATAIANGGDPEHAPLAKALLAFPELLKRVVSRITDEDIGTAGAKLNEDGTVRLDFNAGVLHTDLDSASRIILHELLHGMTKAELANPTKVGIVAKLDDLRQRLVDKLSTIGGDASDRAAYDRAVSSGFIGRFSLGEADASELHANPATRQILYGLLNNDEFVSQAFTSPSMRKFLQGTQFGNRQTFWHKFSGWVKELIGLGETAVPGSAFEEALSHSSQLLQQGEFVASTKNYLERYFERKGLTPEEVQLQTNRATGLILSAKGASPEGVAAGLFDKSEPPSPEFAERRDAANAMFANGDDRAKFAASVLQEFGHPDGVPGLDSFAQNAATGDQPNVEAALESLPDEASKYVFERLRDAQQVLDAVKGAVNAKNDGLLNLTAPSDIRKPITVAAKRVAELMKLEQEHLQAASNVDAMRSVNPHGFLQRAIDPSYSRTIDEIRKLMGEEKPKFSNLVERMLNLPWQMARTFPIAKEIVGNVNQRGANAHAWKGDVFKVMGTDDVANTVKGIEEHEVNVPASQVGGDISRESLKRSLAVAGTPKLTRAINDWIYENQKRNPGKETVLSDSDPEVQKILSKLTPSEKSQVNEMMQKASVLKAVNDSFVLDYMKRTSSAAAIKVLGRSSREFGLNLSLDSRQQLSSQLLEAAMTDWTNPQAAAEANAKVQQVSQALPMQSFTQLMQFVNNEATKIKLIRDDMAQRPGWVSGKDYGRYRITYLDQAGKPQRWSGDDIKEGTAIAKAAGKVTSVVDRNASSDDEVHYPSMTPELINRIRELEQNSWAMQQLTGEDRKIAENSSIASQIEREAAAQGVPDVRTPNRRLSRGAEGLPWLENHFSWVTASANAWTNRLLRAQFDTHLSEPEVQANDEYRNWAKDYVEGYLRKDPELATSMRKFTSLWYLGGNLASAIANPIGNGMRIVSELTATSGKPVDSYARFLRSARETAGNFRGGGSWASAEHEQLMRDAAREGRLAPSLYDENAATQETVSTNFKQMIEGQKQQTLGKRLGTLAGSFTQAAMWPFRMGEIWNSQVALLSAFDLYREQGMSFKDAKEKAFEFNGSVNDTGGRANRPVGPFSAKGDVPRSAAMLSTAMQNFVLGSTFQLSRYLKQGLFRPQGLTPHEVWSARKAATQMLAMQFAAAGALGMPFVSGALALLDKAFPELELNRKLRESAAEFFSSDKAQGSTLSDMAMTGVPSMFGWDMQSRLSMGNTVPGVSELNGFQPEQLLGPPVSLISQFVRGGQRLFSGQGRVSDWTPPALKKLVQLVSSGGDSVNDYMDRPVLNDLTPGEKLGIGLGFQPQRLSNFNVASRIADVSQKAANMQEGQFRQGLATEVLKGNFGTARQELLQRAQQDKTFDAVEGVRAVARAAEDLTFPQDLARQGTRQTSGAREQLLSALRIDPQQPSEVSRLQFRQQVEQRLGLQVTRTQDIQLATLMDQLKAKMPNATRSELRQVAEVTLRRTLRQQQTLQPLSQ